METEQYELRGMRKINEHNYQIDTLFEGSYSDCKKAMRRNDTYFCMRIFNVRESWHCGVLSGACELCKDRASYEREG